SLGKLLEAGNHPRYVLLYNLAIEYVDYDNEIALHHISEAEALALADSVFLVKAMALKAQVLRRLGYLQEALGTAKTVVEDPRMSARKEHLPILYQTIGLVHLYRSAFDDALENFLYGLDAAEALQDTVLIMSLTSNIGIVYY